MTTTVDASRKKGPVVTHDDTQTDTTPADKIRLKKPNSPPASNGFAPPPFDNIADKFFPHGKSLNFPKKLVCTFKSGGEGLQSHFGRRPS